MASKPNGTLYVGVTNDLARRVHEHRIGAVDGFTKKHNVKRLVWYETHSDVEVAIAREKTIKRWPRRYKLNVIEQMNPDWDDLYETLNQ
ncbi:MAG: GIY-YIG nuclease family protein [Rhodospirillaceae bacterium]|nr:GIY-YIG nuclease family protein [Rhodospirillaceae bacterium]